MIILIILIKYLIYIDRNLVAEMINRTIQESYERALEERLLVGLYPNPDTMSYEDLLSLGDRIGYVSRGLSKEEIKKTYDLDKEI